MFTPDVPPLTPYGEIEYVEEYSYDAVYEYDMEEYEDCGENEIEEIEEEEDDKIVKPLDTVKITSGYTGKDKWRTYKYQGKLVKDHHYGIDAVGGKKIYAVASGKVVKVVNKGEKGGTMCLVRIQHKDYQSAYYHCKSGSIKVKVGQWVKKGEHIATIGNTGKATGVHLHFQIDKGTNATAIDPTLYAKGNKELVGLEKPGFEPGEYKTLKNKCARSTPEVNSKNKIKYRVLSADNKKKTYQDKLGYAKFKIGAKVNITQFTDDKKGNTWGKTDNIWLCVKDSTGDQVKKV